MSSLLLKVSSMFQMAWCKVCIAPCVRYFVVGVLFSVIIIGLRLWCVVVVSIACRAVVRVHSLVQRKLSIKTMYVREEK